MSTKTVKSMVPLKSGDSISNTPQAELRARAKERIGNTYVSPHHGDGGWHGSTWASIILDAEWQPLNDRILFRRLPDVGADHARVVLPDTAARWDECRAVIVKVGPGRRVEGNQRQPLDVVPGQLVIIGPHVDWDSHSGEYCLAQEADIRVIVNENGQAHRFSTKENRAEKLRVIRKALSNRGQSARPQRTLAS